MTSDITLEPARFTEGVVVTARRVEEVVQEVPIPVSVLSGELVTSAGAFNVNRVKELIPTVQFYSSNPRNSSVTIRGIGSPFGLTNDGIEPGVGLYIDGVFYARPAAATLDFLDVAQVEVLRGPQGTLFGKNTTAGAINVTSRRPNFTPESNVEVGYGSYNFFQAKASVSGPLQQQGRRTRLVLRHGPRGIRLQHDDSGEDQHPEQPRLPRTVARGAVEDRRRERRRRPHAAASGRIRAGHRRRGADTAAGQSPVGADHFRSRLHPPQLQRVRSPDRHRHELAVRSGHGRRLGDDRLDGRTRPRDLGNRVSPLELGSVQRSRLHRPPGHRDLRGTVEAEPVDAGTALRWPDLVARSTSSAVSSRSTRRSTRTRRSSRSKGRRLHGSCWRHLLRPPRRGCSTAMATTSS